MLSKWKTMICFLFAFIDYFNPWNVTIGYFSELRDYDPSIIGMEFKKMLHPVSDEIWWSGYWEKKTEHCGRHTSIEEDNFQDKFWKRSKQVKLWKAVTLASYYTKLMGSTRSADRIDAAIETVTNYSLGRRIQPYYPEI